MFRAAAISAVCWATDDDLRLRSVLADGPESLSSRREPDPDSDSDPNPNPNTGPRPDAARGDSKDRD